MNKKNYAFLAMLSILLFQACQEAPTQVGNGTDTEAITQQTQGPDRVRTDFNDPPFIVDDGDCLEDPSNPFNTMLGCEDPDDGDPDLGDPGPGNGSSASWKNYFYVHKGKTNSNLYYAESDNGTIWNTRQIGLGAATSSGPATVFFQNQLFVYYKGNSGRNIFYSRKPSPSSGWTGNQTINSHSRTKGEIAATVHDGKVFIAYKGESERDIYIAYSDDGINFDNQTAVAFSASEFALVSHGNKLCIIRAVNHITEDSFSFSVTIRASENPTDPNSWTPLGGISSFKLNDDLSTQYESYNGLAAISHNNELHLTWAFGRRDSRWHPEERSLWWGKLDENLVLTKRSLNQTTKRRPAITSRPDGSVIISYASDRGDELVRTMILNSDGSNLVNSFNSGGATKIEGVYLTNKNGQ